MSTRNIVPRANGEGSIGTEAKHWEYGYFDHITTNDMVSVKDYGAKGDGITNDTDAIEKCITENNVIFFPSGTYLMDFSSSILEKKTLIGASRNDVIIKQRNSNKAFCIIGHYTQFFQMQFVTTNNTEETPILLYQPDNDNMPADYRESELAYLKLVGDKNTIGISFASIDTRGMWNAHITHVQILNTAYGIIFADNGWYTNIFIDNVTVTSPYKYGVYLGKKVRASVFQNISVEITNNSIDKDTQEGACGFHVSDNHNILLCPSVWNDNNMGTAYSIEHNLSESASLEIIGGYFEGVIKGDKKNLANIYKNNGLYLERKNSNDAFIVTKGENLYLPTLYTVKTLFSATPNDIKGWRWEPTNNISGTLGEDDIGTYIMLHTQSKHFKLTKDIQNFSTVMKKPGIMYSRLLIARLQNKNMKNILGTLEVNVGNANDTLLGYSPIYFTNLGMIDRQCFLVIDSILSVSGNDTLTQPARYGISTISGQVINDDDTLEGVKIYGIAFYNKQPKEVHTLEEALQSIGE